jgi:hypothetical protein
MNWYMCVSETSLSRELHGWRELMLVALKSARLHTNLKPHLVYDGQPSAFTDELRSLGVEIIFHRVSFYDALAERGESEKGYLPIASGAFLRVDIPLLEKKDQYVLYTDLDVVFLKNIVLDSFKPNFFSCAPQTARGAFDTDANTGVMVINVPAMREQHSAFVEFIKKNLFSGWPGCDQEHFRRFFAGRFEQLPDEYNWKPYWGISDDVAILHWHGPKPDAVQNLLEGHTANVPSAWKSLFNHNPRAYRHFLNLAVGGGAGVSISSQTTANQIVGHIDAISGRVITGWAVDKSNLLHPAVLEVRGADNTKIADVTCRSERADIKRMFQTPYGGFKIDLTEHTDLNVIHFVDGDGKPAQLGYRGERVSTINFAEASIVKVPERPSLEDEFIAVLEGDFARIATYLEYGSGGSTVFASRAGVDNVISVESDKTWLDAVEEKINSKGSRSQIEYLHVDIGQTGPLGYPIGPINEGSSAFYALKPWVVAQDLRLSPDVILVDGRFRVSCFFASMLYARAGAVIYVDDYLFREHYRVMEQLFPIERMVGRCAQFVVPSKIDRRLMLSHLVQNLGNAD